MATIQGYTKTGVDNKLASRSNVTFAYSGTGTPELKAFPDAKTGDIIERSSDRAQWRVLGNTLASLGHIVTKVNGQTGEVNITAAGLNASPTGHKHTIADITDLTVSTGATADHVVKRVASGNITVPTTPNANTSAASKSYVDTEVGKKANTSHTHTIAQITDLTVSTTATANHVVKRITSGNITVPTTPNANTSATSKQYVDTEVGKKANTSHTHGISDVSGLQEALNSAGSSVHTHVSADVTDSVYGDLTTSPERLVKTDADGYLRAPAAPTAAAHATSKSYVDTEVGKKANTSHTHTISQITDLTISKTATVNHVVQRTTSGNITVPTTPNASTSAASKSYVDSKLGDMANASHTHTKAQITDLEAISTGATGNHIVKRNTDGNITVPSTPAATTSATSKSYVDTEMGKKANTSHTHTKAQITDLETIGTAAVEGNIVKRTTAGNITVPLSPIISSSAASKSYVDIKVNERATSSHTHTVAQITDFASTLSGELAKKANIGAVPVTDDGYLTRDASDPATDYPSGVSYGMQNSANSGWTASVREDTDYAYLGNFAMVLTLRHRGYTRSTTQLVFSYDDMKKPVFIRKWYSDGWGPFRYLTDDGHTHTSANITDARTWTGRSTDSNALIKTDDGGWFYVGSNPTHGSHPTNKSYVDGELAKKADQSRISDATSYITPESAYKLVNVSGEGHIRVTTNPTNAHELTRKGYVDAQVANAMPWSGTRTEYNAITTKDPNRLYIITGA